MKKLLLTSALVAAFASSAFAHSGPTVTLGGSLDTQLGVRSQKSGFDTDAPQAAATAQNKLHKFAIVNDTKVHVKADGKAGNGLKYGGMVELAADTSNDKYDHFNFNSNSNRTFAYVESMFGHLSAGSMAGVADSMTVSGDGIARATMGDAKRWWNPYIYSTVSGTAAAPHTAADRKVSEHFIVTPALPSNYDTGGEALATKVNYMTPTYMGFKAGLTYIPDIEQHGSSSLTHTVRKDSGTLNTIGSTSFVNGQDFTAAFKNIFSGGLHYAGKMSNVGLKASLLGETGDAKNANFPQTTAGNRHDLRAWSLGGSMNVAGFTLAASYGDWGKSGVRKALTTGKKKSSYWTVGAAYEYGSMGASLTYVESKRGGIDSTTTATPGTAALAKAKEHRNVTLGLDYKLAPGFMPYAEVSFFKLDEKNTGTAAASHNKKNDGSIFLAGTKLSF